MPNFVSSSSLARLKKLTNELNTTIPPDQEECFNCALHIKQMQELLKMLSDARTTIENLQAQLITKTKEGPNAA